VAAGGKGGTRPIKIGDWKKAGKALPGLAAAYRKAEIQAVFQEALHFRRQVIKAFKTSGGSNGKAWAPNRPSTIAAKGSSKPLINTGDLMGSVAVLPAGSASFFAGVPNNARAKKGGKLTQIGRVHEEGRVIVMQITKKQHAWFMANLSSLGGGGGGGSSGGGTFKPGGILVIKIPQRSFLQATKDAHFKEVQSRKRIQRRIATAMRKHTGLLRGQTPTK
jgi:hypothetical protein